MNITITVQELLDATAARIANTPYPADTIQGCWEKAVNRRAVNVLGLYKIRAGANANIGNHRASRLDSRLRYGMSDWDTFADTMGYSTPMLEDEFKNIPMYENRESPEHAELLREANQHAYFKASLLILAVFRDLRYARMIHPTGSVFAA